MLKNSAEVIVIGGGVMGTSTAYHLAKLGCRNIVLLEKDQLASGSTGLSVGGIRQQFSDGYADPYSVDMGFAKMARRLGVKIYEGTEVTDIQVEGGQVRGVTTTQGQVSAPVVVNTAGPWAAQVGQMAGVELPVQPYRRQVLVTGPFEPIPDRMPLVIDFAPSFYFRREGVSILMGMFDHLYSGTRMKPNCSKCSSKAKAVVIPNCCITAKLVQSVKLKSLSS
jgi:glycine/D-amino acid oxidase-like deaminating enzyme